ALARRGEVAQLEGDVVAAERAARIVGVDRQQHLAPCCTGHVLARHQADQHQRQQGRRRGDPNGQADLHAGLRRSARATTRATIPQPEKIGGGASSDSPRLKSRERPAARGPTPPTRVTAAWLSLRPSATTPAASTSQTMAWTTP